MFLLQKSGKDLLVSFIDFLDRGDRCMDDSGGVNCVVCRESVAILLPCTLRGQCRALKDVVRLYAALVTANTAMYKVDAFTITKGPTAQSQACLRFHATLNDTAPQR
jgi:hypothetical protein